MIACLGQQNVDGKRIQTVLMIEVFRFVSMISAPSKGFVESSFIQGLNRKSSSSIGGREGLIDTAVKTSETGYIQRKLIKAMEDLKTHSDFCKKCIWNCYSVFIWRRWYGLL